MTLLIAGLLLWTAAHLCKRVTPDLRARLQTRLGDASRGLFAVLIVLSIVLMTLGYQSYTGPVFWSRTGAMTGINNLLMVLAVYLFAASGLKTRITRVIRHPQLTAFKLWAIAHLLVNGDMASFLLFGGLLAWAVVEVIIINRQTVRPAPATDYPAAKEIKALVGTAIVFIVLAGVHIWLGYNPFGA